ncbi:hypothetical protein D9M71_423940 [compost metagenome]
MQAEAMPVFARGEAMGKDLLQVFRGNAFAFVQHAHFQQAPLNDARPEDHRPWVAAGAGHGVLGVADQVDQYQQQPMPVAHHQRQICEVAHYPHLMPDQRACVHAQRVLDQVVDRQRHWYIFSPGVGLLGGHHFLDVVDAFVHPLQLDHHLLLLLGDRLGQLVEVAGKQPASGILVEKPTDVSGMLAEQLHDLAQTLGFAAAQRSSDQIRGCVHAVEHVAHVVQHIGSDLRHACLARRVKQFALSVSEFQGAILDPLFQDVIGALQRIVDPSHLGEAAHQQRSQANDREHQQAG